MSSVNPTPPYSSSAFSSTTYAATLKPAKKADDNSGELLAKANSFLTWMLPRVGSVASVCLNVFDQNPDTAGKALTTVNSAATKQGLALGPVGGISGTSTQILNSFDPDILPGDIDKMISLLKSTGRIHQIGTGKGKALILLHATAISASEYIEKSIDANDAVGLSKALKDAVSTIVNDNKVLREQVEQIKSQMQEKDAAISRLNSDLSSKYKTTWT